MNQFLNSIYKVGVNAFLKPITVITRKFKKNLFFKSRVAVAVKTAVKDLMAVLKKAPDKKSDYVLMGNRYFAKRLLTLGLVAFILVVTLGTTVIVPKLRGWLYTPTIVLTDPSLATFSGKARLVNRSQVVVYEGAIQGGKCEGFGKQYTDAGVLAYEGSFKADLYEGQGTRYDSEGLRLYEGSFVANVYHGVGKTYQKNGKLKYEGDFINGLYSGSGKLYDHLGQLVYSGAFTQNMRNGYGVAYFPGGGIAYLGNFQNDLYQGEGTLLEESGQKRYVGQFANGQYEGLGKAYDTSGFLLYEGTFSQNAYSGQGKLYSGETQLLYEGGFLNGEYSGTGKLYEVSSGKLRYSGNFEQGLYSGAGEVYNGLEMVFSGTFAEGRAVLESFLGKAAPDLKPAFPEVSEVVEMKKNYGLYFKKAGFVGVFNYPDPLLEPSLEKIIFLPSIFSQQLSGETTLADFEKQTSKGGLVTKTLSLKNQDLSPVFSLLTDKGSVEVLVIEKKDYRETYYFDLETKKLLFILLEKGGTGL